MLTWFASQKVFLQSNLVQGIIQAHFSVYFDNEKTTLNHQRQLPRKTNNNIIYEQHTYA